MHMVLEEVSSENKLPKEIFLFSVTKKYMFYVQLAALEGILGPLKADLGVIWHFRAIFLSFQNRFSQNPSWTNLELL